MKQRQDTKIKALARELDVTARRIIDWCRDQGIPAQNSITRLDADNERRVRLQFGPESPPHPAGSMSSTD